MDTTPKSGAELLLESAQRLFMLQGYPNVSMQAIAEEAGMTKGAPYYHFESKEELFYQVSLRVMEQLRQMIAESLDGEGDLEERVAASIVTLIGISGDFSSWINDLKRSLGADRKRCLIQAVGQSDDLAGLVLPQFEAAAERGEFSRVSPEVAARVYFKLVMACVDEAGYLQLTGLLTPEWSQETAREVAKVLVHGIV
jgi:AcrR family transcriptional regulator